MAKRTAKKQAPVKKAPAEKSKPVNANPTGFNERFKKITGRDRAPGESFKSGLISELGEYPESLKSLEEIFTHYEK